MVTFVCENCDATLRKNQLERHVRVCRAYPRFSCIDCSKIFQGDEHKAHTSCISEFEKHHGQYHKPKEKKLNTGEIKNNPSTNSANITNQNNKPTEIVTSLSKVEEPKVLINTENDSWKGWKTTIRKILKTKVNFTMKKKILQKNVVKEYLKFNEDVNEADAIALFSEKVKNKKFSLDEAEGTVTFVPKNKRK